MLSAQLHVVRVIAASIDSHKRDVITTKKEISDVIVDGGDAADSEDENRQAIIKRLIDED